MWKNWVNVGLGIWVIIMPYAIQSWDIHKVVMVVTGVLITVLALWSASEGPEDKQQIGIDK